MIPGMRLPKILLYIALLLGPTLAAAQDAPASAATVATPAQILDDARDQLDGIAKTLKTGAVTDSEKIDAMRAQALDAQAKAQAVATDLAPQLDAVSQRLTDFGPAPIKGGSEAADVAAQRRDLQKNHDAIDSQIKQAKDAATLSGQLAAQLVDIKRSQLQAQLAVRTASPLTRDFWVGPTDAFSRDRQLLRQLGSDVRQDFADAMTPPNRTPFLICAFAALLLLTLVRWLIERTVLRLTTNRVPAGKLRRSSMAVGITLVSTLTTGFAGLLVYMGLNWNEGTLSGDVVTLAHSFATVLFFSAFIAGLGRALLSPRRPSWRLLALTDETVDKIKHLPRLIALAGLIMVFGNRLNSTIGASLNASAMLDCFSALTISGLMALGLLQLARAHREPRQDGTRPPPRPAWASLLILASGVAVVVVWIAVLIGYVTLGRLIAVQMIWVSMVAASTYLLMHLVDDLFDTLLTSKSPLGQRAQHSLGIEANKLDQLSVLFSGISRVILFLVGLLVATKVFGTGPSDIATLTSKISEGIPLGEAKIQPDKIIYAILAFVIGLAIIRVLKRWLETKLLPQTSIDEGMRSSITTLLGYLGGVIVFASAMLTLGLSIQNVAWVASALSVGIGFGLQAIVSNFISGLILLAERPVKVGDWVVLDDAEGDIRRINVRATEIQMADRSTVIVPNSSLITKTVRNMTLANPQGRVLIKLPMPLDTDAAKARELLMQAMKDHPSVQPTPAPSVSLDSVDHTAMTFVAVAYVGSPRDAGGVKSDLLFEILSRLRKAEIPLIRPQDMVIRGGQVAADKTGADPGSDSVT
jgi:potassium efflux system protein